MEKVNSILGTAIHQHYQGKVRKKEGEGIFTTTHTSFDDGAEFETAYGLDLKVVGASFNRTFAGGGDVGITLGGLTLYVGIAASGVTYGDKYTNSKGDITGDAWEYQMRSPEMQNLINELHNQTVANPIANPGNPFMSSPFRYPVPLVP